MPKNKVLAETGKRPEELTRLKDCIQMSEAKHDAGKLPISLVPPQIIRDIAEVREYGVKKYKDPDNWRKVELRRYIDALLRHTLLFMENPYGEDAESDIKHYKHMACNLAFICELMKCDVETDTGPL